MATTKSKRTTRKSSTKPKTARTAAATKTVGAKSKNPFAGFFARKSDPNENILTVFKTPRIWGAILGEVVGTMLLSILFLSLGFNLIYLILPMIAIIMATYALSGAHLNPLVTVGMMATRRVSAIRGILYIVAQVIGAWFGLLIVNGFRLAGNSGVELNTMTELTGEIIWHIIFIELIGAMIIGYFFSRAQSYRSPRGAFTYAAIVAGGTILAILFGLVISGNYLQLENNFAMNPAIAIMYQIFPTSADSFGALMGGIALACVTYIIIPMIGGVLGFYLSEASARLAGECDGPHPHHHHR